MEQLSKVIQSAYEAEVSGIYKLFSQALAGAQGEQITLAEQRFQAGLAHAEQTRQRAMALIAQ